MLIENEIDIVSICTPDKSHFKIIIELLKSGIKGIICEKPIVTNLIEARKVYELTKKKLFYLNHQRRYDTNYQKLKKIINSKSFGNIKSVSVFYPGQLYNILSHMIDILRFLLNNNPKKVSFIERFYNEKEKSATGYIVFEKDIIVNVNSTGQREKLIFELDFISDKGRIKISNNGNKIDYNLFKKSKNYTNYYELNKSKNLKIKNSDSLLSLIKSAVLNYKSKKKSKILCSAEDGFYVISTIKAIEKSLFNAGKICHVEKI
jgi:predicted dehydrogenase